MVHIGGVLPRRGRRSRLHWGFGDNGLRIAQLLGSAGPQHDRFTAYVFPLGASDLTGNWRLEAKVRVVDSPLIPPFDVGGQSVGVFDGLSIWQFNLSNSLVGPVTPFPFSYARSVSLDTVTDYHTYVIEMSQNGPGVADDTANFFVDGSLVFGGVTRPELAPASGFSSVLFGNASSPGLSSARYELVRFDNGEDVCPNSDLSTTVIIDGCDSGVANTLFPTGCTISDLIMQCADGVNNHGEFVSCVAHLTNNLKRAGTITGQQKGAIQSCAAQADIP